MRVMVDWWPEWVSSALALAVAAVSAFVFLRVRTPAVRGVLATLAVQGLVLAAIAPFVMGEMDGSTMAPKAEGGTGNGRSPGMMAVKPTSAEGLPFRFFLTRYEPLGSPRDPAGVRYHSDGRPIARARDGSSVALSGEGGWDPASERVAGGGRYTIRGSDGSVIAGGSWRPTGFNSFRQLPGWYGLPNFREEGWQGAPGSVAFAGFLELRVELDGEGEGLLTAWCLKPATFKPEGHEADGITLTGEAFAFSDAVEFGERGSMQGVMFYGPAAG